MFIFVSTQDVSIVILHRIFCLHCRIRFPRLFSSPIPSSFCQPPSRASPSLTFLHSSRIKNLKALACLPENVYLCVEMSGKGSISRMSDECLITLETVFLLYIDCQAVMRKFTLATESHSETIPYQLCSGLSVLCTFPKANFLLGSLA